MSNFALRHFKRGSGTTIANSTPEVVVESINEEIINWGYNLQGSLYPFCKYLIINNFTDAKPSSLPITLENYKYLRSGYSARTNNELPFLSRWFDLPVKEQKASEFLILILYSREQLLKEHHENKPSEIFELPEDCDYGIVTMQALNEYVVEPMTPYTMVRNTLGIKWGGNGEEINEKYLKDSAEYWETHAIIK